MSAIGLSLIGVGLGACGQRGGLYLPTEPAAKGRTTLPGLLLPGTGNGSGNAATTTEGGTAKVPTPAASASDAAALPTPPLNDAMAPAGSGK